MALTVMPQAGLHAWSPSYKHPKVLDGSCPVSIRKPAAFLCVSLERSKPGEALSQERSAGSPKPAAQAWAMDGTTEQKEPLAHAWQNQTLTTRNCRAGVSRFIVGRHARTLGS